ncbi:MAG: histidine phosphatase family protein [Armatimonadota bacterium]|nr:MAG: histidine phosphatase family protein [Armatimonadota bacterium]
MAFAAYCASRGWLVRFWIPHDTRLSRTAAGERVIPTNLDSSHTTRLRADDTAMGTLFLFRHGETDLSAGHYCGATDPPLNEHGRRQAAGVRDYLRGQSVAAIYASPMRRAVETAEPAADALGLETCTIPALREVDFGEWEGRGLDEVRERYPELWQRRQEDPFSVTPPGGERYSDLAARVLPAFDELIADHQEDAIVVVAHMSVNRIFLAHVLHMPMEYLRRIGQDTAALSLIALDGERIEILTMNERCHLAGPASDPTRRSADAAGLPIEQ